ncbi:MAG: class I SAM-dependent methyltransferase [Candidatus Omnitrophica bacterium]|nr:class I SAM-dependent methyltransferase [Candidatus Omnitrophota bacterium]
MSSKPDQLSSPEKIKYHAELLGNRIKKRYAHLSKKFRKQGIECFRLYDWDIPEIRAVVDWYKEEAVIGEYVRWQTGDDWLPAMAQAVADALNIPLEKVHQRRRQTGSQGKPRYSKIASHGKRFEVQERGLKFWVNLDDFLDTGLFSDHRDTRVIIHELAAGKNFLNLFSYTGAFSCAAASGGAKTTTSVDRSETYLKWANDNLALNGFSGPNHRLEQSDVFRFLQSAYKKKNQFDLAFVDPPSFFQNEKDGTSFDVNDDHVMLIQEVLKVMKPGSPVFFSTNHQRFAPKLEDLYARDLKEITPKTIPEDYRNQQIHRCWKMIAL